MTDSAMLAIPVPLLWRLQVPLRRKLALAALLSSGVFVITAALVRITMTLKAHPSALTINRWGVRETLAGIVAINVPILNPIFSKTFWKGGNLRRETSTVGRQMTGNGSVDWGGITTQRSFAAFNPVRLPTHRTDDDFRVSPLARTWIDMSRIKHPDDQAASHYQTTLDSNNGSSSSSTVQDVEMGWPVGIQVKESYGVRHASRDADGEHFSRARTAEVPPSGQGEDPWIDTWSLPGYGHHVRITAGDAVSP
ncbi:hypothetical protein LTR62_008877 [Meristemomyces frigidus]|uniref:Rhodopsin domain-containing protein n=1 Tax=Meristemomyces frigidus TaxID=1508187 RepID=A0AAN7TA55_9PEZI|nr:hypothetical protein LTR62_008877 [Meristemomyces frigidus]